MMYFFSKQKKKDEMAEPILDEDEVEVPIFIDYAPTEYLKNVASEQEFFVEQCNFGRSTATRHLPSHLPQEQKKSEEPPKRDHIELYLGAILGAALVLAAVYWFSRGK